MPSAVNVYDINLKDKLLIVDGMDIFGDPEHYDSTTYINTHWEMDQIIDQGYTAKLHLFDGGEEITGLKFENWITQWKLLRDLP